MHASWHCNAPESCINCDNLSGLSKPVLHIFWSGGDRRGKAPRQPLCVWLSSLNDHPPLSAAAGSRAWQKKQLVYKVTDWLIDHPPVSAAGSRAWKKKQLVYKVTPAETAIRFIVDVIVLSRQKSNPDGFALLGYVLIPHGFSFFCLGPCFVRNQFDIQSSIERITAFHSSSVVFWGQMRQI